MIRAPFWQGLAARSERSDYCLVGTSERRRLSRTDRSLDRLLRFGQRVIRDHVTFGPPEQVPYQVEPWLSEE